MSVPRYSMDDFEAALVDGAWEQAERELDGRRNGADSVVLGELILDPHAEPPWDKLDILRDLEPRADEAWRRKRAKRTQDWSGSEFDQSLASYAAQSGWSRQEIANLLIAARRKHGDDLKLRESYYGPTIDKAKAKFEEQAEAARLMEELDTPLAEKVEAQAEPEDAETARAERLRVLSDLLKVTVTRFVQYRADPPRYRLETEDGAVTLGEAAAVLSITRFRAAVFAATKRVIPRFKDKDWDKITQALGDACILEDIGEEATEAGQARAWVTAYLAKHPVVEDIALSWTSNNAFVRNGAICVWGERLQQFLANSFFDRVTAREMGAALRVFGAQPIRVHVPKAGGARTTRSAWRLPEAGEPEPESAA